MKDTFEEVDVADFSELLNNDEEAPIDDSLDCSELLSDKHFKYDNLGYFNGKVIIYRKKQYICVLSNHKNLLLVNTNFPDIEKHAHLKIRVDKNNKINLSTVEYVFECMLNRRYPKSNYTWVCCLRLTDDEDYKEYLIRKKQRMKDKPKFINTHKKKK